MTDRALHPRIEEVLAALTGAQREMDALMATIRASVPEAHRREPPHPDTWSITEVVEHLAIVEDGAGRLVSTLIKQVADTTETDETLVGPTLDRFRVWDPSVRRIVAPDIVVPRGQLSFDDAVVRQQEARSRVMQAYVAASGKALGTAQLPHPVLGPLDGYQWGHMTAQHQRRHLTQIRSILALRA